MISHGFFGSDQANPHRFKYSEFSSDSAKPDAAILYLASGQDPRDVALMAKMLSENNPNLKTVLPQHHRLNPPEGRSPADLGAAMAEMGLEAKLIDPKLGEVYTLSK